MILTCPQEPRGCKFLKYRSMSRYCRSAKLLRKVCCSRQTGGSCRIWRRSRSTRDPLFLGRWFQDEVIIIAVPWYLTYPLSYRQVCEMLRDRGVAVAPSTIVRESSGMRRSSRSVGGGSKVGRLELAHGRDLCKGRRGMDVPVQGRRSERPAQSISSK
jgi:hypothetical protein